MLVYLCGPIDLREKDHDWRAKAEKVLNAHGFNVYNPEKAFSFNIYKTDAKDYDSDCTKLMHINSFALEKSDLIIANITGCHTVGTYTELYEVNSFQKPLYVAINSDFHKKSLMLRALLKDQHIYPDLESLLIHLCYIDKSTLRGYFG